MTPIKEEPKKITKFDDFMSVEFDIPDGSYQVEENTFEVKDGKIYFTPKQESPFEDILTNIKKLTRKTLMRVFVHHENTIMEVNGNKESNFTPGTRRSHHEIRYENKNEQTNEIAIKNFINMANEKGEAYSITYLYDKNYTVTIIPKSIPENMVKEEEMGISISPNFGPTSVRQLISGMEYYAQEKNKPVRALFQGHIIQISKDVRFEFPDNFVDITEEIRFPLPMEEDKDIIQAMREKIGDNSIFIRQTEDNCSIAIWKQEEQLEGKFKQYVQETQINEIFPGTNLQKIDENKETMTVEPLPGANHETTLDSAKKLSTKLGKTIRMKLHDDDIIQIRKNPTTEDSLSVRTKQFFNCTSKITSQNDLVQQLEKIAKEKEEIIYAIIDGFEIVFIPER